MRLSLGHRVTWRPSLGAMLLVLAVMASLGPAESARADEYVGACGSYPNLIFGNYGSLEFTETATCPGGSIDIQAIDEVGIAQGENAIWQATAPAGLFIRSAWITSMTSASVNAGKAGAYGGDFYWGSTTSLITPGETSVAFPNINSQDFGFNLVCGLANCNYAPGSISVVGVILTVGETSGPVLNSPSGLWQTSGWIRGRWPLLVSGNSPSGMCSLSASLAGQALPGSSSSADPALWHQCAAPAVSDPVVTSIYPNGADTLQIGGTDATGNPASVGKTLYIDNQQTTVTLSGPSDAPSTAGTQYVTATAAAGPSGVAGISCSVDGGPAQWYPSSTAEVPVSEIGEHQVSCFSENNAVDPQGVHGTSATATASMKIGLPTVSAVSFSALVDKLRCTRTTERVLIPARWVKVRYQGRPIRVLDPAHAETIHLTRCHFRTVRRRVTVWVTVLRHGRRLRVRRSKTVRVLLKPHVVYRTTRVVGHGRPTVIDGWLGTSSGVALGGQTVDVLTAADNGRNDYQVAAVTTTAADGGWSAVLPAGPSRLVTATYAGGATTESALAPSVHLIVPASVKLLSVSPRRVPWGGTVRLVGQLMGGYLPPGGALIRLRIGMGSAVTTYGVGEHVGGSGRFSTTYTFGAGDPATYRSFWFQVASLPMGDYPYAPANSRRVSVLVGGDPRGAARIADQVRRGSRL
jgi:hypothetical protein